MGIKITFSDEATGQVLAEEVLCDEEVAVLETELDAATFKDFFSGKEHVGVPAWVLNAVKQKARQHMDRIVERAGLGSKHTPLEEKRQLVRQIEVERPEMLKKASVRKQELAEERRRLQELAKAMEEDNGTEGTVPESKS